ncbi:hypothetical protein [Leptospira noguchii]|nr:hypothetical protein [Leptospira noguchii]
MSCHLKLGKTKAERFPELSVSLLGSLDRSRSIFKLKKVSI